MHPDLMILLMWCDWTTGFSNIYTMKVGSGQLSKRRLISSLICAPSCLLHLTTKLERVWHCRCCVVSFCSALAEGLSIASADCLFIAQAISCTSWTRKLMSKSPSTSRYLVIYTNTLLRIRKLHSASMMEKSLQVTWCYTGFVSLPSIVLCMQKSPQAQAASISNCMVQKSSAAVLN